MSKYENGLLPYSFQVTVNLPEWKLKDTNVTLIAFLRLFTETIIFPKEKAFFQNYMTNIVEIDKIHEEL